MTNLCEPDVTRSGQNITCHIVALTLIAMSIVTAICSKFLNLPVGVFIASKVFSFPKGVKCGVN